MSRVLGLLAALVLCAACISPVKGSCGTDGKSCCDRTRCDPGLACSPDAVCRPCGALGQGCCPGSICAAGAVCAPDSVCRACGGDGEACCTGSTCGVGAECREGVCRLCGAAGQACCADRSCRVGLRCDHGDCVAPCGDACAPGAQRCGARGGVEVCNYDAPPCTRWSPLLAACPSGQVCKDGACIVRCEGACEVGATLCTSEGLKICVLDPATQCAAYLPAPPNPDNPVCMTGACQDAVCWENPLPQGNGFVAAAGTADSGVFWALDELGNILKQEDGAWTYDYVSPAGGPRLLNLSTCNRSFMAACGQRGTILVNKGKGWEQEAVGESANLLAVTCWVEREQVRLAAVGEAGAMFVRYAAGAWARLPATTPQPTTVALRSVGWHSRGDFGIRGDLWAVGDGGRVVHCLGIEEGFTPSCDGDTTDLAGPLGTGTLRAVEVAVPRNVAAVGDDGAVFYRDNWGGWAQVARGVLGADLHAVTMTMDTGLLFVDQIFVAGDAGAFAYGFNDWSTPKFTSEDLRALWRTSSADLWVFGAQGGVWFNGERTRTPKNFSARAGFVSTRAPLAAVAGLSATDVYAVGGETAPVVVHKLGDAWREEAKGVASHPLRGVAALSSNEIYAVGMEGTVLSRRNGTWAVEGAGITSNHLNAVATDGTTVVAVGENATWLEKPASAPTSSWHLVDHGLDLGHLNAVVSTASDTWAVGDRCAVVRRSGGRPMLQPQPAGCNGAKLMAAWAGANDELYVAGAGGLVFHRSGGQWRSETLGADGDVHGLVGRGNDVWAMMTSGRLFHRIAGIWRPEAAALTRRDLTAGFAAPAGDVFIVGAGGLIWHRR